MSHSNGKVFDHVPKEVEVLSKMTIALCVQLIKLKAVGQSKMKITLTFWSNDFFYRLNDINKSYSSIQKCYLKCSNFWHIHECATHNSTKQWTERTTIYLLHFVYLQWLNTTFSSFRKDGFGDAFWRKIFFVKNFFSQFLFNLLQCFINPKNRWWIWSFLNL